MKTALKIAVIVLLASMARADIKLRIYLNDGTLQAGTLVTETAKSFVILTRAGREEVQKSAIMFINGKTLKQWEDGPDRSFQTEIIPEKLPDAAYVHDKGALYVPPVPPAPRLNGDADNPRGLGPAPQAERPSRRTRTQQPDTTVAAPEAEPVVGEAPPTSPRRAKKKTSSTPVARSDQVGGAAVAPVSSTGGAEPASETKAASSDPSASMERATPPASPVKDEPAKATARVQPLPQAGRDVVSVPGAPSSARRAPAVLRRVAEVPSVPAGASVSGERAPPASGAAVKPGRFTREGHATYHFDRAGELETAGYRAEAAQHLHVATILNRPDGDAYLKLARFYAEEGVVERAERLLEHPALRADERAAAIRAEMAASARRAQVARGTLMGGTAAGVLSIFPLIALLRRATRRGRKRVIDADSLPVTPESAGETRAPDAPLDQAFRDAPDDAPDGDSDDMGATATPDQPEPVLTRDAPEETKEAEETAETVEMGDADVVPLEAPRISDFLVLQSDEPNVKEHLHEDAPAPEAQPPAERASEPALVEDSLDSDGKRDGEGPSEQDASAGSPVTASTPAPETARDGEEARSASPDESPDAVPEAPPEVIQDADEEQGLAPAAVLAEGPPEPPVEERSRPPSSGGERSTAGSIIEKLRTRRVVEDALYRGNAAAGRDAFRDAERFYRTATALDPRCVDGWIGLGFVAFAQEQWDAAIWCYLRALEINSTSAEAHYGFGRTLLEMGRTDEAVAQFRKTLSFDPAFEEARDTLTLLDKAA